MAGPKTLEILIAEDGNEVEVIAHNFQGRGCEAVVKAFQLGEVFESAPKPEYFQQHDQHQTLTQGH